MKTCTQCGSKDIIIERKHSGQRLCQECFIKGVNKKVLKDIRKNKLLEKGDKVMVALSGGKDSVMVLDILNTFYERNIIDLCAMTIDEGIANYRQDGVDIAKRHAKRLGIEHKVVKFEDCFGFTLDEIMHNNPERGACTYCGVFRRWIINREARNMNATKIATGHNLDDETQAVLMNYLEGNIENLTRIGPKTESRNEKFTVKIKPLREIPEREIALYVLAKDLEVHLAGCPYSSASFRGEIKDFINQLSTKHPTMMYSLLKGFDRMKPSIKRDFTKEFPESKDCIDCGEPGSHGLCRACTFKKEIQKNIQKYNK